MRARAAAPLRGVTSAGTNSAAAVADRGGQLGRSLRGGRGAAAVGVNHDGRAAIGRIGVRKAAENRNVEHRRDLPPAGERLQRRHRTGIGAHVEASEEPAGVAGSRRPAGSRAAKPSARAVRSTRAAVSRMSTWGRSGTRRPRRSSLAIPGFRLACRSKLAPIGVAPTAVADRSVPARGRARAATRVIAAPWSERYARVPTLPAPRSPATSSRNASNSASSIGPPGFAEAHRKTVTAQSGCASANSATAASSVAVPAGGGQRARAPSSTRAPRTPPRPLTMGLKALPSNQSLATASFRCHYKRLSRDLIARTGENHLSCDHDAPSSGQC